MSRVAVFVDLPNFYRRLLDSGIATKEPKFLRDYFLDWLDLDLLVDRLLLEGPSTESLNGIWAFYSRGGIRSSTEKVDQQYLGDYINRINTLEGVTARDVDIPGEQRERVTFECTQCKTENSAEWKSEKGIDASLTVHLFDTMDSWDVAYLLSGDADFVPVVASLRRRGKIVIGAGFSKPSEALVRECYQYIDLRDIYLEEDVFAYSIFRREGVVEKWLTDDVSHDEQWGPSDSAELGVSWGLLASKIRVQVYLSAKGSLQMDSRQQLIFDLKATFPNQVVTDYLIGERRDYAMQIGLEVWQGVERRLCTLLPQIENTVCELEKDYCKATYQYDEDSKSFQPTLN